MLSNPAIIVPLFLNTVLLFRSASLTPKLGEQAITNIVFLCDIFLKVPALPVPATYLPFLSKRDNDKVQLDEEGEEDNEEKTGQMEDGILDGVVGIPVFQWMFKVLVIQLQRKDAIRVC